MTLHTINRLISYNTMSGTAIIVCVNISVVGDTTAAKIKAITIKIFRFPFKKSPVTNPILAKKTTISGNSKMNPKGNVKAKIKERYDSSENMG